MPSDGVDHGLFDVARDRGRDDLSGLAASTFTEPSARSKAVDEVGAVVPAVAGCGGAVIPTCRRLKSRSR